MYKIAYLGLVWPWHLLKSACQNVHVHFCKRAFSCGRPLRPTSSWADGSVARANELNLFFNRFDTAAMAPAGSPVDCLQPPPLLNPPPPDGTSSNLMSPSHPSPTPHTSSGSYATCPPLTMDSNSPLLDLHCLHRFMLGDSWANSPPTRLQVLIVSAHGSSEPVQHSSFPVIWKTSCLVPVPKTPQPNGFSDYRPVALTSHWLLQCFQYHQSCSTGWQTDGDAGGSLPCVLDCGLPH